MQVWTEWFQWKHGNKCATYNFLNQIGIETETMTGKSANIAPNHPIIDMTTDQSEQRTRIVNPTEPKKHVHKMCPHPISNKGNK